MAVQIKYYSISSSLLSYHFCSNQYRIIRSANDANTVLKKQFELGYNVKNVFLITKQPTKKNIPYAMTILLTIWRTLSRQLFMVYFFR